MKYINTKAVILHRIDFGESDRILTLLTSDKGKVSVLAKGVRKPKSKLAGGIELFCVSDITYIDGKSDLKTMITAQLYKNYGGIVTDINRTMIAYDILQYTNKYTESMCEDAYFVIVQRSLAGLELPDRQEVVWGWFVAQTLHVSGHEINTHTSSSGEVLQESDSFSFDFEAMAFCVQQNGPYRARHIKFLRLCQTPVLERLFNIQGVETLACELRSMLTDCLKYSLQ